MTSPIERYVAALHEGEQKRDGARDRLLAEDLDDAERARLDAEVERWNADLEKNARLLNDELRALARAGRAPRPPVQLDQVRDPDLRAFCAQVKATIESLRRAQGQ